MDYKKGTGVKIAAIGLLIVAIGNQGVRTLEIMNDYLL